MSELNTSVSLSKRSRITLLVSLFATILLYTVPGLGLLAWPLMLLSTLAHELGHGLAALLIGGEFQSFRLHHDGSGVSTTAWPDTALNQAIVAAGGLLGPAALAAVGLWMARSPRRARVYLGLNALLLGLALGLVVRNLFGFAFVGVVAAFTGLVALRASPAVNQLVLVFGSIQLALSVFSRADYLFTPVARTASGQMPSDVAQIAQALWLPYWFWGALCGLLSLLVLVVGLWSFVRGDGNTGGTPTQIGLQQNR